MVRYRAGLAFQVQARGEARSGALLWDLRDGSVDRGVVAPVCRVIEKRRRVALFVKLGLDLMQRGLIDVIAPYLNAGPN